MSKDDYPSFLELLSCHDEFVFNYNGIKYEIVNGDEDGLGSGISLYLSDSGLGKFIKSFNDKNDFLNNGRIDGKKIFDIINEIEV